MVRFRFMNLVKLHRLHRFQYSFYSFSTDRCFRTRVSKPGYPSLHFALSRNSGRRKSTRKEKTVTRISNSSPYLLPASSPDLLPSSLKLRYIDRCVATVLRAPAGIVVYCGNYRNPRQDNHFAIEHCTVALNITINMSG